MSKTPEAKQHSSIWPLALLGGAAVSATAVAYRTLRAPAGRPLPGQADPGTAFITGASSGIGAAFTRRLAALGYDLIITARRTDRLETLADELRRAHGVDVRVEPADLANLADVARLETLLGGVGNLDFVINNAGFGTNGVLADIDVERQSDMINVHVMAPMRLSRAALPGMIARRQGAIINVSSIAAFMANPTTANYCATKAYLNTFSEGLQREVVEHGIYVQALCPGYTYSEFHDTPEYEAFSRDDFPKVFWKSADEVAVASLDALGTGHPIFVPGGLNRVLAQATRSRSARLIMGAIRRRGKLA
jgi:short-subunit dehydrogenase